MSAIDVGAEAIDRDGTTDIGSTHINHENPANDTGALTSVELWCSSQLSNCEVATFEEISEDRFTTRDSSALGTVTSGSKQTFSGLDIEVETGDYIGFYASSGVMEKTTVGEAGLWGKSGDYIPCSNEWMSETAGEAASCKGIGATPSLGKSWGAIIG